MNEQRDRKSDSRILTSHPLDEERTQELIQQIRDLLDREGLQAASALLSQLHPADQLEVMEGLSPETQQEILTTLPPQESAEILEHLEPEDMAKFTDGVDASVLSDILDEADPDVAADILRQLPEEKLQNVLDDMEEADDVVPLLQYPDDSAGGRMILEFIAVKANMPAASALESIRRRGTELEDIHSIFVVGARNQLLGSVSITRLALANPTAIIKDIMNTEIISMSAAANQEECARVMKHYDLDQLPVVDNGQRLVGVIMSKDVLEIVEEEATEDMYKLAGLTGERVFDPLRSSIRNRLPWLFINLATTFLAAAVISVFQSTISKVVVLAIFLPVVAGQGGIGGTQTLTLVVRSMALGDIPRHAGHRLILRELSLGILHGLILGLAVGLLAYLWKGNYMIGVVLSLAMFGNMIISGLAGAGVPLLLTRLKIDPAVASAVIVTTCTDVFGFLLFLGLATILVRFLL